MNQIGDEGVSDVVMTRLRGPKESVFSKESTFNKLSWNVNIANKPPSWRGEEKMNSIFSDAL